MPTLVVADDATKKELEKLAQQPAAVAKELIRVSATFIKKGFNRRVVDKAASKLGVTPESISSMIAASAHFLSECARVDATERDVQDSVALLKLGGQADVPGALCETYAANRTEIRAVLSRVSFALPHFSGLEWRLDVELGSRCMRNQVTPMFLLKIDTEGGDETRSEFFEVDPVSLKHVTASLETALAEAKTAAARRVMRNIK